VEDRIRRSTGTRVTVRDLDFGSTFNDASTGQYWRWEVECVDHGARCQEPQRWSAMELARHAYGFCEKCSDAYSGERLRG
jgi:hypothetical protein